jgi:hypothetical protein
VQVKGKFAEGALIRRVISTAPANDLSSMLVNSLRAITMNNEHDE